MARLVIESGDEKGRETRVSGPTTIGRLRTNAIPIQDPMSSREHTRVEADGARFIVQDMGSRNGTYLNGQLLKPEFRQILAHGDKIQIGRTILLFVEDPEDVERRRQAEAAAPPPPPPAPMHAHPSATRAPAVTSGLPQPVHYLLWVTVFASSLMLSKTLFDKVLETVLAGPTAAGRR